MKSVRVLVLFVGVMTIAAMAEAQCQVCRNFRPMPWYQGACVETYTGVCSSQCCWQPPGTPCALPDNDLYYCNWTPDGEFAATRYFTSAALTQNSTVALTRKAGTLEPYQRDAAKRRIPRRCPART